MPITIKDIINLPILKNCVITSGKNGLNNVIKRVSFFDHSEFLFQEEFKELKIELPGDFFITSLFAVKNVKNREENIIKIIKHLIFIQSSGLCIVKGFINELPQSVINYSNKYKFPILLVENTIPYAEIINAINEIILINQENIILEMKIDRLISGNISRNEVAHISNTINRFFKNYVLVIYFEKKIYKWR